MAKFGMTGAEFVESAESYLVFTSAGRTATGVGVKKMRKEIVKKISDGLRKFFPSFCLENPNVFSQMKYPKITS